MKVLVLGARGQLGAAIERVAPASWDLIMADRSMADLAVPGHAAGSIAATKPHAVINAAAWTEVDRAEEQEPLATRINGIAVGEVAEACSRVGASLLQVSTDYVFDGSGHAPWTEESEPAPLNAYGRGKLVGERACRGHGRACVVRTSWLHSSHGRNFIRTILRHACERTSLRVVDDQIGAPTQADWLAATIVSITEHGAAHGGLPPILHAVPVGHASWHAVACHAVRTAASLGMALQCSAEAITAVTSADYPLKAMRPRNSRLDARCLDSLLARPRPSWHEGVEATVRQIVQMQP